MTVFPTWYTDKGSADSTDKVWASDGITNFNITVWEIGDENFTDKTTTALSEWTNLYYTETRVTNNTTVVSKADKTNVIEKDSVKTDEVKHVNQNSNEIKNNSNRTTDAELIPS